MTQPLALIQLISQQTMQNLVPVLALKPGNVVHIATPKTFARSAHIVEAARQAHVVVEPKHIRLTEMPSIPETSRAVVRAIAEARAHGLTPIVNFTGGTKLMSIGAFEAAKLESVTSLYVDTDRQQFLDGESGPKLSSVLGDDFSFTPIRKALTVNAVAVANGRQRVTAGRDWKPFLELALHLLKTGRNEIATWGAVRGPNGICLHGREPRRAGDWLQLLDKPLLLPPQVAKLAVASGLLRAQGAAVLLADSTRKALQGLAAQGRPDSAEYYQAIRPLQFALGFLSGGWWEVAVADGASRSGQFRDLRWSVNVGERDGGYDVEEDLVGLDDTQIAYFSCKRGGAKDRLVPLLDELDNRARSIGGDFTRRFLAIYLPPVGQTLDNLKKRASELGGIRTITPADLQDVEKFTRTSTLEHP